MSKRLAAISITALAAGVLVATGASGSAAPTGLDATLSAHLSDVRGSAGEAYTVYRSTVDNNGAKHVRYTRTYNGLRVYGGDFVMHTAANGLYKGSSNGLSAPLSLDTTARVSAAAAQETAKRNFVGKITEVAGSELFVDASSGYGRLAWETTINGWQADGQTPSRLHVVTDALTGAFLGKFDKIQHVDGTGNSIYSGQVTIRTTGSGSSFTMVDPTASGSRTCDMNQGSSTCTTFSDTDNVWGNGTNANRQSAGVDAHFGAQTTFDYFKNVHGRNGIFGNGTGVPSRVHYGNAYVNAFWDGSQMTYGDGTGNNKPLVSLDVAGHEMSHGVTENVVSGGLTYSGESGGLNEATSDIFGNMVEFYANVASDPGDYQVGEEIDINGNGTPLRYMYNPGLDGSSHTCWSTSTKNVDVHYSSGPANHFFYNLAESSGGISPACGSNPGVTGIGRAKAEKIWFKALNDYFTSNTSYVNTTNPANTSRAYTLTAAADLHGSCSTEYKAVQAAWTSVNVAGSDAACPVGNDFSIAVAPASGATNPGGSLSATVNTAITNGAAQTVNLTSSGAPAGVTVSFSPTSVTSGGSSTMSTATAASTAAGTYNITVTGTGTAVTHTTTYALTINGAPGCSGTNPTDVTINDNATVESAITISGCAGNAGAGSTVEVHIVHTYIGDLLVELVAPDGTAYALHNRAGGSADNINQTYTVNLGTEVANGTWKLRVNDNANSDVGKIDTWTLNLTGGGTPSCGGSNATDVAIPDNATVESSIVIAGCSGNASSTSTAEVHIVHTYRGDLVVTLVAPDGSTYVLLNRSGGSADNVDQTFTVNLSGEARNGTWKLRVQDAATADTGRIDTWTLSL